MKKELGYGLAFLIGVWIILAVGGDWAAAGIYTVIIAAFCLAVIGILLYVIGTFIKSFVDRKKVVPTSVSKAVPETTTTGRNKSNLK